MTGIDPSTAMEAATEGAKALTKLQEIIQKMFNPKWTMRQADAEAYANARKLQTIRENPDMEIVFVGSEMHARERTPEAYAIRAGQREIADSIRQEKNLENVIDIAASEVQDAEEISDAPVDEDWIARLFSIVKDMNSEEMQQVWGKILAGEIKQPGSFSMRTLDTIRNLSKRDAEDFQKILPFVLSRGQDSFVTSKQKVLDKFDINYSTIMRLSESGLLKPQSLVQYNFSISAAKGGTVYSKNRMIYFCGKDENETEISIGVYELTKAACELMEILSYDSDSEYVLSLADSIFSDNKGKIKVSIHEVNYIRDGQISYKRAPIKQFGLDGDIP